MFGFCFDSSIVKALFEGDTDRMKRLHQQEGININSTYADFHTPLSFGSYYGNDEIVNYCLETRDCIIDYPLEVSESLLSSKNRIPF